ncbi:Bile acid:sodium symporter [Desulfarculus baarsii DSM 2075]|uniref:Bile acid:sodium symporter n=1 Tax=Desulfarculus baarsii (strain ATCC 33931 / DSM 2075 / LMG 7858 / VKM B-1802 / 2st14) TaxID=644282 RepID=E1QEF7_DESB2|nr:bile acid:sodium symporter [Desulfarculus baarsii]ADK83943.1 Bile acid:sodium symporter [Desulfarculus baarsii DSM 2075]
MQAIINIVKDNLLVLAIIAGLILGWTAPGFGLLLKSWSAGPFLIALIFFCQGMAFKVGDAPRGGALIRLLIWGFIVAQALSPLLGWAVARVAPLSDQEAVGFMLICAMAPTLVSGAVLADRAGGDWPSALILAVGINLVAVLTIPLILRLMLGASVSIDVLGLLGELIGLVLIPAIAGHLLGRPRPALTARLTPTLKLIPVFGIATLIYISTSANNEHLTSMEPLRLLLLAAASLIVHLTLMVAAYFGARGPFGLAEKPARALAVVCSEKTLPVAVAVWSLTMAQSHPLALLAPLVFHPSQIIVDGFIAGWWARRPA